MTTAATIFGHLPLVLVTGPGSAARNSIGTILVAGMAVGTMFTLFVVPVFYSLIAEDRKAAVAARSGPVCRRSRGWRVHNGLMGRLAGPVLAALLLVAAPAAAQEARAAGFWQRLGDTTLARLTTEALQANQDVQVAQARVRQAQASRLNAQLDLAPTVTVAGGYTRTRISSASFGIEVPDRNLWDAELRAAWEIDVFGRLRGNLRGQNALGESAREDVRDVWRLVASEVATAYFELRGAQEQLEVSRRNAENQRSTLQLTRDRLEAGRGTPLDTERAQAWWATLSFVPVFESRVAAAQHRIAVLVGGIRGQWRRS
jgi:outer membrane protein TolC